MNRPGESPRRVPLADLAEVLRREDLLVVAPDGAVWIESLAVDSREVRAGSLFFAVPGSETDGHRFVAEAVGRGAAAVVVGHAVSTAVPQVVVRDPARAARALARCWYGDPAARLTLHAVTGTNGKTTTTAILRHLLNGRANAGSIGTLGAFDGAGGLVPSSAGILTTPGPLDLQATFARLRDRGVDTVVMEASSHSLHQGRLDGLLVRSAVFTNLTRDHLDYHRTMEAYREAKLRLLDLLGPDPVIAVNADDPAWRPAQWAPVHRAVTFGIHARSDLSVEDLVADAGGSRFSLTGRFGRAPVHLPLLGEFNVANALGAAAAVLASGLPLDVVARRLGTVPQVPGRMERLAERPGVVLRDYAHTPDALDRALEVLRPLTPGRLVVLFGCGGDRDRGKRPLMGAAVDRLADYAIVTSDNPRTEDPEAILDEITPALTRIPYDRVVDRREAIVRGVEILQAGDTLLLAGKGHETYQVVGTTRVPFDERVIVEELLGGDPGRPPGSVR